MIARANTGIQIAYEYAGGRSSPPPVAVDGPDAAETGASVEYVAEKRMSNVPCIRDTPDGSLTQTVLQFRVSVSHRLSRMLYGFR